MRENAQRYREANRRILAEKAHAYYAANKAARLAYLRRWKASNPDRERLNRYVNNANQTAKRFSLPGRLSIADLHVVSGPCAYCGGLAETWDHVVPLSKGGANSRENLAPSCHPCNRRKGSA